MDLSVIIVNYNTFILTYNCIDSIYNTVENLRYEIIVIDNNSTDRDPRLLTDTFPLIRLLPLKENVGFARANNLGMKQATGKYLLLLNSDTLVLDKCIEECYRFMESPEANEKNIGVLGCKLLNPDKSYQHSVFPYLKNTLWVYFKTSNPLVHWLSRVLKTDEHSNFNPDKTQLVGDISGAFMFLRRDIAARTRYFDEDFFMYSEDSEWCQDRLIQISNICYYPKAEIIHFGGQSTSNPLMFLQAKLSLSLRWFKRGLFQYAGYVLLTYVNILSMIPVLPFVKNETKKRMIALGKAYWKLLPYILLHIPLFKNNHGNMLIYHKLKSDRN